MARNTPCQFHFSSLRLFVRLFLCVRLRLPPLSLCICLAAYMYWFCIDLVRLIITCCANQRAWWATSRRDVRGKRLNGTQVGYCYCMWIIWGGSKTAAEGSRWDLLSLYVVADNPNILSTPQIMLLLLLMDMYFWLNYRPIQGRPLMDSAFSHS